MANPQDILSEGGEETSLDDPSSSSLPGRGDSQSGPTKCDVHLPNGTGGASPLATNTASQPRPRAKRMKAYTEEEMEADRRLHEQIIKNAILASRVYMIVAAITTHFEALLRRERPSLAECEEAFSKATKPFMEEVQQSAEFWLSLHQMLSQVCSVDPIHVERWLFSYHSWRAQRYIASLNKK